MSSLTRRRLFLGLVPGPFACFLGAVALGNNNFFLPGDAFFPTELTQEDVAKLKADATNPPVFRYSALGGYDGAFCGFAGYSRATIPALDEAFVANLKSAYARVREFEWRELREVDQDGVTTLVETNPARVLFYRHDFDFPRLKLGLQYNENWVAEVMKFGHARHQIRLCCLVNHAEAVMESWRDATDVAALTVSLPQVELRRSADVDEPITIDDRLKAIVLGSEPLTTYFRPEEYETPPVVVVDSAGITELTYRDRKWVERSSED